jgi:hypothetical protein
MNPSFLGHVSCADSLLRGWARAGVKALLLCYLLTLAQPLTMAAAQAGGVGTQSGQFNLPQGIGWENWQVIRDQNAQRGSVRVLVPKGEAAASAKVRVVLVEGPKPNFDSTQAILDNIVQTAKQQCEKVSANPIRKSDDDLIYELRGYGCGGQKGGRYLLQRIAVIKDWELRATYASLSPTDDLPPLEKAQAIQLLSSVTIVPASSMSRSSPRATTSWFLITPPKASSHYDTSAPLTKWKVEEGAGSLEKCRELQAFLSSLVLKQGEPSDIEEVKDARCISVDDPGFEGN